MTSADERTPLLASTSRDTIDSPRGQYAHNDDIITRVSAILGALKAGKLPSTDQIDAALSSALDTEVLLSPQHGSPILKGRLSEPTFELLTHLRSSLESFQKVLKSKNSQDELQEVIWASEQLAALCRQPDLSGSTQDLSQAIASGQTLLWLILRNVVQESRALVEDLLWTIRTVAADTAEDVSQRAGAAARKIRPEDPKEENIQEVQEQGQAVLDQLQQKEEDVQHEGRQRVLMRLNKAMESIRNDPESTRAASTLLTLARKYLHPEAPSNFKPSPEMEKALDDFRAATLRFLTLWTEVDLQAEPFQTQLQTVLEGPRANEDVRNLLESVINFGHAVLSDPTFAQSDRAQKHLDELSEQVTKIKSQHSDWWFALMDILHTAEGALQQILQDSDLQALAGSLAAITASAMDLSRLGARTLLGETRGLVSDLVNVLLPRLLGTLTRCPFPRVEYKSPFMDAVCDDFVLQELYPLPTYIRLDTDTSLAFQSSSDLRSENVFDASADLEAQPVHEFNSRSRLFLRGVHFSARDISFYVRRKAFYWLPCFRVETGFVDVTLSQGAEADIEFVKSSKEGRFIDVKNVTVRLPGLDLQVRQSFHPLLMWITRRLVRSALKVALRYVLSNQLKEAIEKGDERLFALKEKANGYEARGFSSSHAWFAAITEKDQVAEQEQQREQEEEEEEEQREQEQEEDQPKIPGMHLTSKGIVKPLDPSEETALAVGAGAQILPEQEAGPEHYGPSGAHGPGSAGRIAAELDAGSKAAMDELRNVHSKGQQIVNQVGQTVSDLPRMPQHMQCAEDKEKERASRWRSPAFNL